MVNPMPSTNSTQRQYRGSRDSFDDEPTLVETPEEFSVAGGTGWVRPDGQVYVCLGAAGGYGPTVEAALASAARTASALRRLG